jgi:5-methyltetrahydrofolate--homocysteine methyltransferase
VIDWEQQPVAPRLFRTGYSPPEYFRVAGEHGNLLVAEDVPLQEITAYIDWTFFFHAWQLKGRYPAILEDADKGEEARKLLADAEGMLQRVIDGKWLRASAVVGLFAANAVGDDVEVYSDARRDNVLATLHFLRKQGKQPRGRYNESLADFIAPKSSGVSDYIGGFAATAGLGIDSRIAAFEADHDDYSALMLKALADRLAEALTEWLHLQVRTQIWGYAADERLGNDDLIAERYRGIRPAMGYPASPDHTEKDLLWELLDAEKHTGIWLTESRAMAPAASVSGLYFAHPQSRYFTVGKIARDQLVDYAARKGYGVAEMERWLGPNLGYEPR